MHLLVFIFQFFFYGFSKIETTCEFNVYHSYDLPLKIECYWVVHELLLSFKKSQVLDKFMVDYRRIRVNESCKFSYSCRFRDRESARIEIYHQVLFRLVVLVTGCHYKAHPGNFYRIGDKVVGGFVEGVVKAAK
jgi:hypothetical protein